MRYASLGSGSRGNATLVEHGKTRVLIDCGFSLKQVELRLARLKVCADTLSAILVSHEHSDHVGGVARLAAKYNIPVWMTAGTHHALKNPGLFVPRLFSSHQPFAIEALGIEPFPVPHDAKEPCQFVIDDGNQRLAHLTDLGQTTAHIDGLLAGCSGIMIETNHDEEMLQNGAYPQALKRRVAGKFGHLSNRQTANILAKLDFSKVRSLAIGHISEKNNLTHLALAALVDTLDCPADWVGVATQDQGLDWQSV